VCNVNVLHSTTVPDSKSNLTPRGAIVLGIFAMLCGVFPVLAGLGVVHVRPEPGSQPWVAVAAGSMFILAGLAIINGYAVGGASTADGRIPESAPLITRVLQYVLGLGIVGLMFSIFAWVAFGSGERHFSSSISIPGLSVLTRDSERVGRIAFGIFAVFIGLFFVVAAVLGARSLRRSSRNGANAD